MGKVCNRFFQKMGTYSRVFFCRWGGIKCLSYSGKDAFSRLGTVIVVVVFQILVACLHLFQFVDLKQGSRVNVLGSCAGRMWWADVLGGHAGRAWWADVLGGHAGQTWWAGMVGVDDMGMWGVGVGEGWRRSSL